MFGRKRGGDSAEVEIVEDDLPAGVMRGTEPLYGYVVALELAVVAVLSLVITHGKGAPKHPARPLEIAGLVGAIALIGLIQTKKRFLVGFGTMVVTLLVVLPGVPSSLLVVHFIALVIAFLYGYTLTRRQNKARLAQTKGTRADASAGRKLTSAERRAEVLAERQAKRDKRRGLVTSSGPKASARYTPPKPRRNRPGPTAE